MVLTGSLTTYQWSAESDFDISLWVGDTGNLPLDEEHQSWRANLVRVVIDNLDGTIVPGTTHPLQCFVVDKDRFTQYSDIYQPGLRSAWDIDTAEWIQPPERERTIDVRAKFPDLYHRGLAAADKMKLLLKYDKSRAGVYWNYLHHRRRTDMLAGRGDYADSNIVYKMLANSGMFEGISEATGQYIASRSPNDPRGPNYREWLGDLQDHLAERHADSDQYMQEEDEIAAHQYEHEAHLLDHEHDWIEGVIERPVYDHRTASKVAMPKLWDMSGKERSIGEMAEEHILKGHDENRPLWDCPYCVTINPRDPMYETVDPRYQGFKPEASTQETYPCPGDCGGTLTKKPNTKLFVFEKEIAKGGDPRYPIKEKTVEDRTRSIWDCDTCGQSWFGTSKTGSWDTDTETSTCMNCKKPVFWEWSGLATGAWVHGLKNDPRVDPTLGGEPLCNLDDEPSTKAEPDWEWGMDMFTGSWVSGFKNDPRKNPRDSGNSICEENPSIRQHHIPDNLQREGSVTEDEHWANRYYKEEDRARRSRIVDRGSSKHTVDSVMCRTCNGSGSRKHPNDPRGQDCPECDGHGEIPDTNCEECDGGLAPRPNIVDGDDMGGTMWECDDCGTDYYSDTDFYKDSSVNPHTPEEGASRGTAWTDHLPEQFGTEFYDGPRKYNDQVDGKFICQCGFSTDNEDHVCDYCRAVGHLNGLLYGDQLTPGDSHDGEQSKMEQYKNWWKKSSTDVCFKCGLSYSPQEGDDPHNHPFAPGDVHPIQCWCGFSDDYHHSFQSDSDPRYEPVWPR